MLVILEIMQEILDGQVIGQAIQHVSGSSTSHTSVAIATNQNTHESQYLV